MPSTQPVTEASSALAQRAGGSHDWVSWLVVIAAVILFGTVAYLCIDVAMMNKPPEVVSPSMP